MPDWFDNAQVKRDPTSVDPERLRAWALSAGFSEHPTRPDEMLRPSCSKCGSGRDNRLMLNVVSGFVKCWGCGRGWKNVFFWLADEEGRTVDFARNEVGQKRGFQANPEALYRVDTGEAPAPTQEGPPVTAVWYEPGMQLSGWFYDAGEALRARGFDETWWAKKRIGFGTCDRYHHRIVLPVYQGGKFVWLQAWDYTRTHAVKYHSPKRETCEANRSTLVYQADLYPGAKDLVIVEGIFDAWAMEQAGIPAVCAFGKEVTPMQIGHLLLMNCAHYFCALDPDAQKFSNRLAMKLSHTGAVASYWNPGGDLRDPNDRPIHERASILAEMNLPSDFIL